MGIEIVQMPELRVGAMRHIGAYDRISEAFDRLSAIADSAGLFTDPSATLVGIYYDNPAVTPQAQLRSDAGITLAGHQPLPGGLTEQRLPAGRYARKVHIGPYEGLPRVWASFLISLPSSGHRAGSGPNFEIYRNTPAAAPKEELLTELYLPLA